MKDPGPASGHRRINLPPQAVDGHNLNYGPAGFEGTRLALDAGIRGAGPMQRARSAAGSSHGEIAVTACSDAVRW